MAWLCDDVAASHLGSAWARFAPCMGCCLQYAVTGTVAECLHETKAMPPKGVKSPGRGLCALWQHWPLGGVVSRIAIPAKQTWVLQGHPFVAHCVSQMFRRYSGVLAVHRLRSLCK
jgi:hypothetical protein